MKTVRNVPLHALVLALALALFVPATVLAELQVELPPVYVTSYSVSAHASSDQRIEVTIVNPRPARAGVAGGNIEFEWKVEEGESFPLEPGLTTIEPGEARTFTLDPRASTPRQVIVGFELRSRARARAAPPPVGVSVETVDLVTKERRLMLLVPAIQVVR